MNTNLERDIGKILAKLENLEKLFDGHIKDDRKVEERVTSLEKGRWYLAGVLGTIAFLWAMVGDYITKAAGFR